MGRLLRCILNTRKQKPFFDYRYSAVAPYHSNHGVYGHNILQRKGPSTTENPQKDRNKAANPNFYRLVNAFREHGHRIAHLNPLFTDTDRTEVPEIVFSRFHLPETFSPEGLVYWRPLNGLLDVDIHKGLDYLRQTYTNKLGYEFMYIEDEVEREWFAQRAEELVTETLSDDYKVRLALEMVKSQNFDHFLASKFASVKRYGGEGCESMMAFFVEMLESCSDNNVDHVIIGMAHRGRLNLLSGPLQFPTVRMFQKMKGMPEFPTEARASGDVLSHLYTSVDIKVNDKHNVHVSFLPNPSHLETVNPMAIGKARGKMKSLKDYDYSESPIKDAPRVLSVQVHGDAALAGQGINQETLGFAQVPNFRVGGSIHLVINNQVGYTTPADRARSSRYTSDVAKMIGAPVIHVNGDCPEELVKATRLAMEYRRKFHRDVFIDLICFRRWGHNEMDDPTFTNPQIYSLIQNRKSIPDVYSERLIAQGLLKESVLKEFIQNENAMLGESLKSLESYIPKKSYLEGKWSGISQAEESVSTWDTGVDTPLLQYIGVKSVEFPNTFNVHSHLLKTFIKSRINKITQGTKIDWATAEALAMGSLLYQGFGVRLTGEDVGRGTFSQRHAMLVDQKSGEIFIPLNSLVAKQSEKLEIANSTLSEEAVIAFEYGFSLECPSNLVIWEAQFGDFFNGAQIPIDTLVTSGETKWMLQSGMVMLLPHGMDGAGPEHSSCRMERFLQMTDSNENGDRADGDYNNFQVVNPTTPAQYFHILRQQMLRNFRKPLVVVAPKVLLRLPAATSNLEDMGPATSFQPVLNDTTVLAKDVKKLIFVSGKHFYNLREKRDELGKKDVGIIRIESLCPFPVIGIREAVKSFPNATDIVWSQEEHQNMGAWSFIKPRFENFIGRKIKYVGRGPLATPAVGVGRVHQQEILKLMADSFATN